MSNINICLEGYPEAVVKSMIAAGYAKTKTEALRLALFEFDRSNRVVPGEETAYSIVANKILDDVKTGKVKTKPFSIKEL